MRRLLVLLLLLPGAAASQPTEPYAFDTTLDPPPALGVPSTLTVTLDARVPIDAPLRLDVPAWVRVDGDLEWRAQAAEGERIERAWNVTATRAGFWRAGLAVDASRAAAYGDPVDRARSWQPVAGCCLFVWSTQDRALAAATPEGAVPGESTVGFHTSLRAVDAERAELTVRVSPQDKRYAGQELLFQIPLGSAELQRAPAEAPHDFTHVFPLADGATTVLSPAAYVRVTFEGGEHAGEPAAWSQHVACANIQVAREGDVVQETDRWGCMATAAPQRAVPAPPWPLLGLALLLASGARSAYPRRPA